MLTYEIIPYVIPWKRIISLLFKVVNGSPEYIEYNVSNNTHYIVLVLSWYMNVCQIIF